MSPASTAPENHPSSSPLSPNASTDSAHHGSRPSAVAPAGGIPNSLSRSFRSKTAPLALNSLWTPSVDQPQLSERDSIFATTYRIPDSPSSSVGLPSWQEGTVDHDSEHAVPDVAASPVLRKVESPTLHQQRPSYSSIQHHQGLLSTRFNSYRPRPPGMEYGSEIHEHTPPFMSPVDSPVNRPSTPHDPEHIRNVHTPSHLSLESEERLKYRSWREGKVTLNGNNVSGVISNTIGKSTQVDKKIEATLPKAEQHPGSRSRKASHFLRVFKENDAAEEQRRRENRTMDRHVNKDTSERTIRNSGATTSFSGGGIHKQTDDQRAVPMSVTSRSSSVIHTPLEDLAETYFEAAPTDGHASMILDRRNSERPSEDNVSTDMETESRREFPLRLLEEIRSHHNLTPGADRGSSFSKSLPSSAVDRLREKSAKTGTIPRPDEVSGLAERRRDESEDRSAASEEDESEREQISSALYFPHRRVASPEQVSTGDEQRKTSGGNKQERRSRTSTVSESKGWIAEEDAKTPGEVEISLQSQDTNQCLHGDLPASAQVSADAQKQMSWPFEGHTSAESDYESLADSSHSFRADESSATDDLAATPTATPVRPAEAKQPTVTQPQAPLGAVELKPYDHQVGGHTTVYRFSRRAVCKQLNNRENEFYETVEQHHPELLEFLPRYEHLPSVW